MHMQTRRLHSQTFETYCRMNQRKLSEAISRWHCGAFAEPGNAIKGMAKKHSHGHAMGMYGITQAPISRAAL